MTETVDAAVAALNEKLGTDGFDGKAKMVIENEGSIIVDEAGAREADEDAEVTLTADAETFRGILEGTVNATAAFMSGQLSVDGDMGQAMKLAGALS